MTGGADVDTVTNTGLIDGNVDLEDGDNELINEGEIGGDVTAGGGNDTSKRSWRGDRRRVDWVRVRTRSRTRDNRR